MSNEQCSPMSVMLTSRDTKAAAKFYVEKLGFEMKESWPSPEDPMWCSLVLNNQAVMIGSAPEVSNLEAMCEGDPDLLAYWTKNAEDFQAHQAGVGIQVYISVEDVDGYFAQLQGRGIKPATAPKTQFYGIRDFGLRDLDGYSLVFFTPVSLTTCQSCGMPLADSKPGQMYCDYCTNDKGELKPYEQVFEGTVQGYFMGMQKMARAEAEVAAKEMLEKMPAWGGHCKA